MPKESFSLRITEDLKNKLDLISKATGRTKSFIAIEAIKNYCDLQSWQIDAIQEGIRQADNNEMISHEEIRAKWESKRANQLD